MRRADVFPPILVYMAASGESSGARTAAMRRLTRAMTAHPDLVAGEGRACTELMRAMGGRVAVKTGAEAVFVAIAPDRGLGIALKVADGATRAGVLAIVKATAGLPPRTAQG